MPATMIPTADTEKIRRLVEFAADVAQLAAERRDLDLRELTRRSARGRVAGPDRPPLHRQRCDRRERQRRLVHAEPDPLAEQKPD